MKIRSICSGAVLFGVVAAGGLMPSTADAYSVKVHIHLANEIRDELVRNMEALDCTESAEEPWCGKPAIRLKGPGSEGTRFVIVSDENAEAIRDNPEFWRGGAIGPDNTVFPGMTDPSHAWMFAPFSQCQFMLDNAEDGAERAYALGCFLHGITDNNAHHLVNYFSGETFTLFPKDGAKDGELVFSLLNVVRHMTVEGKFEKALETSNPAAFHPEKMKHQIAGDLYRRVYLSPVEGRGLWHFFAGQLVERKNDALRAAHLEGFDPNEQLEMSIEEIKEQGLTIDLDGRVIDAYVEFLKTGGTVDGLTPGEITPADYILLLPEIIEDVKRLLEIADARGVLRMEELVQEWKDEDECAVLCPILRTKKELYEHLFGPGEGGEPSLFRQAVDLKTQQLDQVIAGYISTVERLSNLIVAKGVGGMGLNDIKFALEPMAGAIDKVTDFPYEIFFPAWAVDVLNNVAGLREFLEGSFRLVTEEFKRHVVERAQEYLAQLREQLLALAPPAVQHIREQVHKIAEEAKRQIDEAKLKALGLDVSDAEALLDSFETGVLYMNSYNSIAGAVSNQEVVFSTAPTSFFGGGPISFDASYQVHYNQLTVCDDLRKAFYPCGNSAIELLQPDFHKCEALDDVTFDLEPNVECHDGAATEWVTDPNPAQCVKRHLPEITGFDEGHLGSYTLAYPPELADRGPECVSPVVPGINGEEKFDNLDDDGDGSEAGCGCATDRGSAPTALFGLLLLPAFFRRRLR